MLAGFEHVQDITRSCTIRQWLKGTGEHTLYRRDQNPTAISVDQSRILAAPGPGADSVSRTISLRNFIASDVYTKGAIVFECGGSLTARDTNKTS